MTRQQLKRVRYLRPEIKFWEKKLDEMTVTIPGKGMDGMPHAASKGSAVESRAMKNMELKNRISEMKQELERLELEITLWVTQIEDPFIRLIVQHRFLNGCSWDSTAAAIGPGTTSGSCKMALNRWLEKEGIE